MIVNSWLQIRNKKTMVMRVYGHACSDSKPQRRFLFSNVLLYERIVERWELLADMKNVSNLII